MKAFANVNPKDLKEATGLLQQASKRGKSASVVAGGSDLLGMVKERLITPDVLVNLKSIRGLGGIAEHRGQVN
ncbi:MAG: FAD binding domain-containing protein, partial [Bryobacteraceae bacterium]